MKRILALLLLLPLATLPACGGSSDSPEDQITAVVDQMNSAETKEDFQAVCQQLFTSRFVKESYGDEKTCVEAPLKEQKSDEDSGEATVDSVAVDGDRATVKVSTDSDEGVKATGSWQFVSDGGDWKLDRFNDDFLRSTLLASVKAVDQGAISYEPMRDCMAGQVSTLKPARLRPVMFQTLRGNKEVALDQILAIAKTCPRPMAEYVADGLATRALAQKNVTRAQIRCARKQLVPLLQLTDLSSMALGAGNFGDATGYALAGLIAGVMKHCPA